MLNINHYDEIRTFNNIGLYRKKDGEYIIYRHAERGNVKNYISNYEWIDYHNTSHLIPIDYEYGNMIIDRLESGENFSDVFVFYEDKNALTSYIPEKKSQEEHKYTSTGIKFWRHQEQMFNYKNGNPKTVISTHISPEGTCNLKCPYCSVTYRDTHSRIDLDTIKDYVLKLKTVGLKAVILTGGGEPTLYKNFNELVRWIKNEGLSVALITNGTQTQRVDDDVWKLFSWIRVSINIFNGWTGRIKLPIEKLNPETVVGCSMVYTVEHESSDEIVHDRVDLFKKVSKVADNVGAKYIRLLPNCLLTQENLLIQHRSLDKTLEQIDDKRYFHQYKIHGAPKSHVCHQSFFRPYLSEEIHVGTGKSGTVYPCDSVVLNDSFERFAEKFQLCHSSDILEYLNKRIEQQFDAKVDCSGCVFTSNVDMLDDWVNNKIDLFEQYKEELLHEEFV